MEKGSEIMTKFGAICFILTFSILYLGCKEQVKQEPTVQTGDVQLVQTSNEQLSKYPLSGYGYKSAQLDKQKWEKWAVAAAPVIKGILEKLPEGYAIEIRGHTDGRGPEQPEGKKPGNMQISADRAKIVYDSLKIAGIDSPNLKYRGVGSTEPIPGIDLKDAQHRRVTFVVVKK